MYQEWFDAIPLLYDGAYDNNIRELERAIRYYEKEEDYATAEAYRRMLSEEKRLKRAEEKYAQYHPIKYKFKNMISSITDIFE